MNVRVSQDLAMAEHAVHQLKSGLAPSRLSPSTWAAIERIMDEVARRYHKPGVPVAQIMTVDEQRETEARFAPADLVAMDHTMASAYRIECFLTLIRRP